MSGGAAYRLRKHHPQGALPCPIWRALHWLLQGPLPRLRPGLLHIRAESTLCRALPRQQHDLPSAGRTRALLSLLYEEDLVLALTGEPAVPALHCSIRVCRQQSTTHSC